MPGRTVIQWEKDDLDPVGLVKIDLLGLGMLTRAAGLPARTSVARAACHSTSARLDMDRPGGLRRPLPRRHHRLFQVESRAQMNTLPRLKPRCFYDLVVEVALIRPGPIQGDMVHPYLRRRAGVEAGHLPASLARAGPQAHARRAALPGAGHAGGHRGGRLHARRGRRAAPRHGPQARRTSAWPQICRAADRGHGAERHRRARRRARIYKQINAFADYGFPESHAASFALLVYASAYLRHYYPPEYMAAILNAQPMGFYSPGTLVEDAKRHGVEVRPVDALKSGWDATLEQGGRKSVPAVRLGFRSIRGLGTAAPGEDRVRDQRAAVQCRRRCGDSHRPRSWCAALPGRIRCARLPRVA